MSRLIDLTGRRFGALTVVSRAPGDGSARWVCRCDCGKDTVQSGYSLRKGLVTSCGCGMFRASRRRGISTGQQTDYTGQTFGNLTAVRRISRGKWLWKCSCGGETVASPGDVRSGRHASCGCLLKSASRHRVVDDNVLGFHNGTSISVICSIVSGKLRSTNTTGYTGIRIRRTVATETYSARITVRGQEINLGTYATLERAVDARKRAEQEYFGELIDEYDQTHPKKPE